MRGALTTCWSCGINNTPVFPFCSDSNVPAAGFSSDEHAEGQSDGIFPLLPPLIPLSSSAARHPHSLLEPAAMLAFWGWGGDEYGKWAMKLLRQREQRRVAVLLMPFEHESAILCRAKSSINMSGDDVDRASSSPQGGEKSQNIKTNIKRVFFCGASV